MGHQTFQDQVIMADLLVATKIDLCSEKQLDHFAKWSKALFPAKQQIVSIEHGELPIVFLDEQRIISRNPNFIPHQEHKHSHEYHHEITPTYFATTQFL